MKLLKKIFRSKFLIKIRNLIGIKPIGMNLVSLQDNYSVSDGFLWRTDNGFKTTFNFSDLIKIFFHQESAGVEIFFYDKNNKFLKKISKVDINYSNSINIDEKLMNNLQDFGMFYIYHKMNNPIKSSIRNACYTGYSYMNNLHSFVHGNFPISYKFFDGAINSDGNNDIIALSLFKNKRYKIQKYFKNFSKSEIFIQNPTSKKIKFSINTVNFELNGMCGKIIDISNVNEVEIISNCYFFRPIIFNYKNNYLDVHHG
jgi:hypothetical protein